MTGRARLTALLILLGVSVGVAYWRALPDDGQGAAAIRPAPRRAALAKSRADIVEGWKADILARPLIYPGRRAPSPAPAITADRTASSDPPPRLTGVIVGPAGRHALFATGSARPVTVDEGGRVGPYTIRAIRSNEVVVDGPGGVQSLHPTYQDVPPPASAPAPPFQHAAIGLPPASTLS